MGNEMITPVPCPAPFNVTIDAAVPHIVAGEFNAAQLANHQEALNYTKANKGYAHTFEWKPNAPCCQVTNAVLTVHMKSIEGGTSATSIDAGNDLIAIVGSGGTTIMPYHEPVYGPKFPFPAGTLATKTWNLTGAALAKLNTSHMLSFYVQDDTTVLSATLALSGCCLNK
jgi:hypothetical protein